MIDRAIVHLAPGPKRLLARFTARRLIGGATLEAACELSRRLNAAGRRVSLGLLGEDVLSERAARQVAADQRRTLEEIEARGLDASLSVKLSGLGLAVDEELCFELALALVEAAGEKGSSVLVDMERSEAADGTLRIFRRLREAGHESVGLSLQARLRRTVDDIQSLAGLRPRLSICKGAYVEAVQDNDVAAGKLHEQYLRAISRAADCAAQVGISTHDGKLIEESRCLLSLAGRPRSDYEIQLLLGMAPRLEEELVRAGEPVRVYVPFGTEWRPYLRRRLAALSR